MQQFETGIMSTVIQLEAPDHDTAAVASILYFRSNAPIVFYAPEENKGMPSKWCNAFLKNPGPEIIKEFDRLASTDAVKTAYKTIKEK